MACAAIIIIILFCYILGINVLGPHSMPTYLSSEISDNSKVYVVASTLVTLPLTIMVMWQKYIFTHLQARAGRARDPRIVMIG